MRSTRPRTILVALGLLALAGCTSVKALEGPPRDLRALYETSLSGAPPRLSTPGATAHGDDPLPTLLQPPSVQKVWVPAQRTPEGDLVAGHWTYLLLEAPQWRLDQTPPAGLPLVPLPLPTPTTGSPTVLVPPQTSGPLVGEVHDRRLPVRPVAPVWPPAPGEGS